MTEGRGSVLSFKNCPRFQKICPFGWAEEESSPPPTHPQGFVKNPRDPPSPLQQNFRQIELWVGWQKDHSLLISWSPQRERSHHALGGAGGGGCPRSKVRGTNCPPKLTRISQVSERWTNLATKLRRFKFLLERLGLFQSGARLVSVRPIEKFAYIGVGLVH